MMSDEVRQKVRVAARSAVSQWADDEADRRESIDVAADAAAEVACAAERVRVVARIRLTQSKQPEGTSAYLVLASVLRTIERGEHLGD